MTPLWRMRHRAMKPEKVAKMYLRKAYQAENWETKRNHAYMAYQAAIAGKDTALEKRCWKIFTGAIPKLNEKRLTSRW